MTGDELDRVVALLKTGKRFSIYGADGEWGFDYLGDGRFRSWLHAPYEDAPDQIVDEASVRSSLSYFGYDVVMARITS